MAGRIGDYGFDRRLGVGGMSDVWEGWPIGARHRRVAVKVFRLAHQTSREEAALFLQEGRLGALLNHPAIARTLDLGIDDGRLFIVFELLQGRTLNQLCPPPGMALPPGLVVAFALPLLDALDYAHRRAVGADGAPLHVVHRDIKPSNLMLTQTGEPKILDFGIALNLNAERIGPRDRFQGTLAYSTPEQAHGESPDARSDLFSFGIVLHEMLAGRRLFDCDNDAALLSAIVTTPAPPLRSIRPEIPEALELAVAWALRKERQHRPESAADLAVALQDSLPPEEIWDRQRMARWYAERVAAIEADSGLPKAPLCEPPDQQPTDPRAAPMPDRDPGSPRAGACPPPRFDDAAPLHEQTTDPHLRSLGHRDDEPGTASSSEQATDPQAKALDAQEGDAALPPGQAAAPDDGADEIPPAPQPSSQAAPHAAQNARLAGVVRELANPEPPTDPNGEVVYEARAPRRASGRIVVGGAAASPPALPPLGRRRAVLKAVAVLVAIAASVGGGWILTRRSVRGGSDRDLWDQAAPQFDRDPGSQGSSAPEKELR